MERLCERPGCSDAASVSYGMVAEDLVFWLQEGVQAGDTYGVGVLCRRHADTMVVPRGWTLDDRRDPDLRLFRPDPAASEPKARARRPRRAEPESEQLSLDAAGAPSGHAEEARDSWTPTFDPADDLDGLLSPTSPLLARAFRGDDRPREG